MVSVPVSGLFDNLEYSNINMTLNRIARLLHTESVSKTVVIK
jgi:hypothetical protein